MTFDELQRTVNEICQEYIDAYAQEWKGFQTYADERGLLTAIQWRTSEAALKCGMAQEASKWNMTYVIEEEFDADYFLDVIRESYKTEWRMNESTNRIGNAIEDYEQLGRQKFRLGYDAPLRQIEKAVIAYQEAKC